MVLRITALAGLIAAVCLASCVTTAPRMPGQKIVMATHSFSVYISQPPGGRGAGRGRGAAPESTPAAAPAPRPAMLTQLSDEAGFKGQEFLAVQMIGNSTPMQHWEQGGGDDSRNIAKVALNKGGVDVFTMSPNLTMPEPAIDLFADLVIKTNPKARILFQNSWLPFDGRMGGGGFNPASRDVATAADIDRMRRLMTRYGETLRIQMAGVDARAGKEITFLVPASEAVYMLREEVAKGTFPGVTQQSTLFADSMGHPTALTSELVTYAWFTVMYRQSPIGLKGFTKPGDPLSAAQQRILQQIAWNAVVSEPKSGVKGEKVKLG